MAGKEVGGEPRFDNGAGQQLELFPGNFGRDKADYREVAKSEPARWEPTWFEAGGVKFAAYGDRLLIIEDEFRSGYECRACGGTGTVGCDECRGTGAYLRGDTEFKCAQCEGRGRLVCGECNGKGALLVVPDTAQRRPSTGRVVSVGDRVEHFDVGDNVLYSNFAGHAMDIPMGEGVVVLRILHEKEILAAVEGHLEISRVRNSREALGVG